jgi:hypothetical protein
MTTAFGLDNTFGRLGIKDRVDSLALPEYLTAPFPTCVSLQSALCLHARP